MQCSFGEDESVDWGNVLGKVREIIRFLGWLKKKTFRLSWWTLGVCGAFHRKTWKLNGNFVKTWLNLSFFLEFFRQKFLNFTFCSNFLAFSQLYSFFIEILQISQLFLSFIHVISEIFLEFFPIWVEISFKLVKFLVQKTTRRFGELTMLLKR